MSVSYRQSKFQEKNFIYNVHFAGTKPNTRIRQFLLLDILIHSTKRLRVSLKFSTNDKKCVRHQEF